VFGFILHVVAGQPGGRHDHHDFQLSGVPRLLGDSGVRLLGDSAYSGLESVQAPATRTSIPDRNERVDFNIDHTNRRSRIEQFFSVLKQWFTATGRTWHRADRKFLAVVFVACCLLYNRRKRLNL
jgi:DDE superfamily endonuclease